MKKYIKNKNFIPRKFYNIKAKKEFESINKMKFMFIILNLILLPLTIQNLYLYKENKEQLISNEVKCEYKVKEEGNDYNDIVSWFNNIYLEQVENAAIDGDSGEITINDMSALKKITNEINIKNINNDNNNYILGVELKNEKE